ncbi:quinon protein alcohol dehydrogenase-like superfamily [Zychaea mexicana]|uniref:quinon protein alcohol dehydrogenase-like superfamily n=1 Tax=Zychaea mexicana TaxID=64656 RepID=UPI0022FE6E13|nr:quinon protein alcohol dehydrogenase-like superfamily [Zychaea mexicana]KAI9496466.1 quinon protein alcohol dehydrogenase-like superfamily [Zychaea mexicana]
MTPPTCSTFAVPVGIPVYGVTFTPTNQLLIGGGGGPGRSGVQNKLVSYKVEPRRKDLEEEAVYDLSNDEDAPMCLDAHPTENVVVAGINSTEQNIKKGENKNCRVFKVLESQFELTKSLASITSKSAEDYQKVIRFNSDGTLFATGSSNGQVRVYSYPSLEPACDAIESSGDDEVMDVDISLEKDKLTFLLRDAIKLVNLRGRHAGKVKQTISPATIDNKQKFQFRSFRYGRLYCKDFAYLVANSPKGGYVVKLDAYTLERVQMVRISKKPITAFCISQDGGVIAAASSDYTISLYESNSLRLLYQLKEAHGFAITSIAISPDRRLLASGSADNSCRIITLPEQFSNAVAAINPLKTVLLAVVTAFLILLIIHFISSGTSEQTLLDSIKGSPAITTTTDIQATSTILTTTAAANIETGTITASANDNDNGDSINMDSTTLIYSVTHTKDEL